MTVENQSFWKKYRYGLWTFYYLFCTIFYYLISIYRTPVVTVHSVLDDLIPFCEVFIIPYVLWYLYLMGTFVLLTFKSREQYLRFCIYMYVGLTIGYIIFAIWPSEIDFRQNLELLGRENIFTQMVGIMYKIDLKPVNVCPSLHCYGAIVMCVAISKSHVFDDKKWLEWGAWILSILVCMSTMLIKQHSILDFFAAVLMAVVIYPLAYKINWKFLKKKEDVLLPSE